MSKILVLATDYPKDNGPLVLYYIHTRNIEYKRQGIEVTVLNFSATENYEYDGIPVISLDSYRNNPESYDLLVAHAPNLRNHYRFFKSYADKFAEILIFFHGHEVLLLSEAYPKPYAFQNKNNPIKVMLQDVYDKFKFKTWRKYFIENRNKITFVFVSEWMLDQFNKNIKIPENLMPKYEIIHNSSGRQFQENIYTPDNIEYDYITIRSNIDGSKYCIDVVNKLAYLNPDKTFLVIGKGTYFDHYEKADNIIWENKNLKHDEIIPYLNKSRVALLPTRTDAQGVMACEMTTFGIPLITSNIDVCQQVLKDVQNVTLIDNDHVNEDTLKETSNITDIIKSHNFDNEATVDIEIQLINDLITKSMHGDTI